MSDTKTTLKQIEDDSKMLAVQIGAHCHLSDDEVDSLFYAIHVLARDAFIDGQCEVLQSFKTDTAYFTHLDF